MHSPTHSHKEEMTLPKKVLDWIEKLPPGIPFYLAAAIAIGVGLWGVTHDWNTLVIYIVCFVLGYFTGWCMRHYVS